MAASTDRFTETETRYEKTGGDWFRVSSAKSYLTDNSDTATVQSQRERLTGFTVSGTEKAVAEAVVTNIAGNSTRSITTVDRAAKRTTTTTDTPESNVDAVSVAVNGLLQSSTTTTPQTATTYIYDALGRMMGTIDARAGAVTKTYNPTSGQLMTESDGVQSTSYDYYPATHTSAGRLKSRTNAAGKKIYFDYSSRGEMVRTWGETTYPMEYVYDGYGQRVEMRTFRGGAGWTAGSWSASPGAADVTRWEYEAATGLIERKVDAAGKAVAYSYDALGRAKTRNWARGTATSYAYTVQTGELSGVDYADQTPDVTFSYDRGGRQAGIVDAAGERTLTHTAAGEVKTDRVQGGVLDGVQTSVAYDPFLRRDFLQAARGATVLMSQTYGYDSSSRLQTITSDNRAATYAYHPNGLLNTTGYTGGMSVARSYDNIGRLASITTSTSSGTLSGYSYTYNNLHQRTKVTREDGSYWLYSYNDRGEVMSGKRYWADNTLVWGQQGEYAYDNIGNRNATRAGGNALNQMRQASYATNSLNQYTGRSVAGAVDVTGTAQAQATVTVNNEGTVRKGDYFYKELAVDNQAAPVSAQVNVVGARQNFGAGGEDAVTEKGGRVVVAKSVEAYSYDVDGNLTADGLWTYRWDGENRLTSMESLTGVAVEARQKLEFSYDYMGRRIEKRVSGFNVGTGTYQLQSTTKFVYDGWNLVAEVDGNFAPVRSYVWGQDVSGTMQGAGGVGGLLAINEGGQSYQAGYDGNGNLTTLVKAGANTVAASYEYDAFGQVLKAVGEYAERNPVRFSTKYTDGETGLLYYGYRYYQPQTGRWLNRDPMEEEGGVNLYAFVTNDSVGNIDLDGLQKQEHHKGQHYRRGRYDKRSPNWDRAAGRMRYTRHSVTLCIPGIRSNLALDKIYSDIAGFTYLNSPHTNVSNLSITGNVGHFLMTRNLAKTLTYMSGNSIDVELYFKPKDKEVMAVTLGDHPLVGVRRWYTQSAGVMLNSNSESVVQVTTEAYEQISVGLSTLADEYIAGVGAHLQNLLWSIYISNVAETWKKSHGATVIESPREIKDVSSTVNPFRKELPSGLQQSRYIQ